MRRGMFGLRRPGSGVGALYLGRPRRRPAGEITARRRRSSVGCACGPYRMPPRYASNPGPSSGCLRAYSTVAWR